MRIGIPKEIKPEEGRISLTPYACSQLVDAGHEVYVQQSAGALSGYKDEQYSQVGAIILDDAASIYDKATLIVKVKEPVEADLELLTKHHILFCFLHLAPAPELLEKLRKIGLTAIGFETVETEQGGLPLLAPMSTIAGRLAGQIGAHLLHEPQGGKGILLGGLATTERGNVTVMGAGNAGLQAVDVVASLGANVTVFDIDVVKLEKLHRTYPNVTALVPTRKQLHDAVTRSDLLVGAVLVTGCKTPVLVNEELVSRMEPGSVIIDIAVDQGGCIETIRPTDYEAPTYMSHDVVHFGVTNMPGAVPRSSSQALSAAIMPYVLKLADQKLHVDPALRRGINLEKGQIIHPALINLQQDSDCG